MNENTELFDGAAQTAKVFAAAIVTGVVVAAATNYGMKAYDKIKAKRAAKKDVITELMEEAKKQN